MFSSTRRNMQIKTAKRIKSRWRKRSERKVKLYGKRGEGEEKSVSWRNLLHSRLFCLLRAFFHFTSDEPRCLSQSVWHLPLVVISDVCNVLASHFSDQINWICLVRSDSPSAAMPDKLVGPAQWIDVSCVNVLMLHHEWVRNVGEVTTLSTLIIALLVPETNLTSSIPSLHPVGGASRPLLAQFICWHLISKINRIAHRHKDAFGSPEK